MSLPQKKIHRGPDLGEFHPDRAGPGQKDKVITGFNVRPFPPGRLAQKPLDPVPGDRPLGNFFAAYESGPAFLKAVGVEP